MRILLLSEDNSVFDDYSLSLARVLEYAALSEMLFVVVASLFEKNSNTTKKVAQNSWIYRTNSLHKFLRIWDVLQLVAFEIRDRKILQADLIVCEDFFISILAGSILARKYKRPLYILLTPKGERTIFSPMGLKNILRAKVWQFILSRSEAILVDNFQAKEKLQKILTKSGAREIEIIRPFASDEKLTSEAVKEVINKQRIEGNFIEKKFPQFKFTAVTFVNTIAEAELALNILKKLNTHFPPTSLILIFSNNTPERQIKRLIEGSIKPFVYLEPLDSDLPEYLASSNVFWGISEGEKYEEVLNEACIVGSTIIAREDPLARRLIEDNVTGFVSTSPHKEEIISYFAEQTFFIIKNPSVGLGFKMNIALSFKQQFGNTKEEYMKKLKLSWEKTIANYKKDHLKYYRF